jgi:hypothetical protein
MALTKSILKLSESEVVVKVAGAGGNATIDLQTDLITATQALEGTQTVTITGVRWSGETTNTILIERNSVRVLTLPTEQADYIAFDGQELPPENTQATQDITVSQVGTGYVELYLKLRKVSGYAPKIETAAFGPYDNPNVVGS